MQITHSTDDQLMAMAAFRYCLGRRSYIVGSCLAWLDSVWTQLSLNTQAVILRDIISALMDGDLSGDDAVDIGWKDFAERVYVVGFEPYWADWLQRAVSYKNKPWPLSIGGPQRKCNGTITTGDNQNESYIENNATGA